MELPIEDDFLYEELAKAEETIGLLRAQSNKAIKERGILRLLKDDLTDIVEYLRKHLAHTLANEPAVVKTSSIYTFDARYDCRRCASDWQSLVRFRECGGKL